MTESFLERRRAPRVAVRGDVRSDRALAFSVRLIDIGMTGVLLASPQPLEVGQQARLSARLGDCQIDADILVRRVSTTADDKGSYQVGARFISLGDATRHGMEQFLAAGGIRRGAARRSAPHGMAR